MVGFHKSRPELFNYDGDLTTVGKDAPACQGVRVDRKPPNYRYFLRFSHPPPSTAAPTRTSSLRFGRIVTAPRRCCSPSRCKAADTTNLRSRAYIQRKETYLDLLLPLCL